MTIRRRKKSRKMRGSRTHGWGFGKRHRAKGNKPYKGGGVGKRGAHLETYYLAQGIQPIGKHGIAVKPRTIKVPVIILSIKEVEERLQEFQQKKIADSNNVDLTKLGFVKLLSEGQVSKKLNIICSSCSAKAKEKIEKAGGSVTVKG